MSSPAVQLRKTNSTRGYLHPFKSFSTSRLQRRVEASPEREKPKKEGTGKQGFFSQLKRSFTMGHRSSSSSSTAAAAAAAAEHEAMAYKGAPAASADAVAVAPRWGRRVKHGISKPFKAVTDSYMGCMMKISEDGMFEGLEGMGFQGGANSDANAFQLSASRRKHDNSSPSLHFSSPAVQKALHT